jgi:murein DD-endopeptidase MepM/ murein hydrolase activator NlpD
MLHLDRPLVQEGQTGKTGNLVAICDNTGFSTGPHCHKQWRRVLWDGKTAIVVDKNDANNSFDPTPFFEGFYAQDVPAASLYIGSLSLHSPNSGTSLEPANGSLAVPT